MGPSTLGTDSGAKLSADKMLSKLANYFRGKGEAEEKPRELKFDQALGSILGKARGKG